MAKSPTFLSAFTASIIAFITGLKRVTQGVTPGYAIPQLIGVEASGRAANTFDANLNPVTQIPIPASGPPGALYAFTNNGGVLFAVTNGAESYLWVRSAPGQAFQVLTQIPFQSLIGLNGIAFYNDINGIGYVLVNQIDGFVTRFNAATGAEAGNAPGYAFLLFSLPTASSLNQIFMVLPQTMLVFSDYGLAGFNLPLLSPISVGNETVSKPDYSYGLIYPPNSIQAADLIIVALGPDKNAYFLTQSEPLSEAANPVNAFAVSVLPGTSDLFTGLQKVQLPLQLTVLGSSPDNPFPWLNIIGFTVGGTAATPVVYMLDVNGFLTMLTITNLGTANQTIEVTFNNNRVYSSGVLAYLPVYGAVL